MTELKEQYLEKLNKLEELINEVPEGEEEPVYDYVLDATYHVYKSLIDHDQFIGQIYDAPVKTKKLVRLHCSVPQYVFNQYNVERIAISALFAIVDVYMIPTSMIKAATNRKGYIENPCYYGLPSDDEVNYGTRKTIDAHTTIAIAKNSWTDGILTNSYHYEYVTLN